MEEFKSGNPLKRDLNAQENEQQLTPAVSKQRGVKLVFIMVIILVLLTLCGGVFGGILLLNKSNRDKNKLGEEKVEQEKQENEEAEDIDELDDLGMCVYDNGNIEITFKVPENWDCIQEEDEIGLRTTGLKSDNIEFWVGFTFEEGCQNEAGECEMEALYESDAVKLYRIFNVNPDGTKYVITQGYFYKDGEMIQGGIGINWISPDLQNRSLTKAEQDELYPILDSVKITYIP